jgi:hypothetical protein
VEFSLRDPATQQEIDRVQAPRLTAAYAYTSFDPTQQAQPITLSGTSSDRGVDTDGDGLFNQLQVNVGIQLPRTDIYEWSARLVDKKGTEIGFYTRRAQLSAGTGMLNFVFDGERIGRNGVDGPYFVKSLLIFGQSGGNLVATDVAETQAYAASAFEGFQPKIEGDLNGDGKVDQADVVLFQQAYGSVRGDPNYNPDADFDGDGRVTVNDLRILRSILAGSRTGPASR